ncbi:MAG: hypothetical protein C0412_08885 [Flavobacterium sp.]|nr:hypothetical protein [Flavobacterium sp.]
MATLAEIYDWFMTGKKPTQAQFWASWGSFWNKGEQIPQSSISGLPGVLNAKAEKAQFDAHKTDENAHADLFDAKEDKTQKGVAGGYVPLDEFTKIANEYLTIVNDLVTGGATSLASAETVKTLKTQIDGINTLLTSNDVNLDTVQEIVDAIKTVETSLSTILVNDLTTGGTTKAATAETVKTLKGLIDGLYANETIDTLLAGKANQILALKTITGTTYNVIYDDISNELVYEGTVAMNIIIPNNATLALPIGTVFYSVATNTGILSVSGGAGVVFQTAVGLSGAQNEVRKYTKRGINTWGVEGNVTSSSDMILASTQTVSGLKTFLNGVFGLRNVANTFTSFFTNANTASRTYTLPDRSGTLADNTDIASINTGKMNTPAGTVNYLSKFLTATTIGLSRLFDNGTFFGIGTVNAPTKDMTFGNQTERTIGIEDSDKNTFGKNLTVEAGRSINFDLNTNFNLFQSGFDPTNYLNKANGEVYAFYQGYIYKQNGGVGPFLYTTITGSTLIIKAVELSNLDIIGINNANMYKQTAGTGAFVLQTPNISLGTMRGIAKAPNNDVYVLNTAGNIYLQVNGTGNWSLVETVSGGFEHIIINTLGNIYITQPTGSNSVWKKSGAGAFAPEPVPVSYPRSSVAGTNGDIYFLGNDSGLWKQTAGVGGYTQIPNSIGVSFYGSSMNVTSAGDIMIGNGSNVYIKNSAGAGSVNLDGGTLKLSSGTGKGAGKSRLEFYTGNKLASGTDMQAKVLREYIDENGYHIYASTPIYADNAAAIAGGLPVGCAYKTATGVKMEVY